MFLATFISYVLIIFFSLKITQNLRRSQIHMSKRTKIMNKQLHRTLTVQVLHFVTERLKICINADFQAIGPLVTGNLPICVTIILIFLQYENHYVTLGLSCFFAWIAVINPVAAIFIITPYRMRVKQLLRLKVQPTATSTSKADSAAPTKRYTHHSMAAVAPMPPLPEDTIYI